MSLLSENVATVVACDVLNAKSITTGELTTGTVVSDTLTTNFITLVDPNNSENIATLEEVGGTLNITSDTVQINGNVIVGGTLTLSDSAQYPTVDVAINAAGGQTYTLSFVTGLFTGYTVTP